MTARTQATAASSGPDSKTLSEDQARTASLALMEQLRHDAENLQGFAADSYSNVPPNNWAPSADAQSCVRQVVETAAALDGVGWPHELWPQPDGSGEGRVVRTERDAVIRSFYGWEFGGAVDRLSQVVTAAGGDDAPWDHVDEARAELLAVDAELMKLREDESYDLPDDKLREVAWREVDTFELDTSVSSESIRVQLDRLTLWRDLLDRVGWPEDAAPADEDDES